MTTGMMTKQSPGYFPTKLKANVKKVVEKFG